MKKIELKNETRYFLDYDKCFDCHIIHLYEVDDITGKRDILVSGQWHLKLLSFDNNNAKFWSGNYNYINVSKIPEIYYNMDLPYELDERLFYRISRGIEEIKKYKKEIEELGKSYDDLTVTCKRLIEYIEHFLKKKD